MTRILVTGANGHIGANVVRDLAAHDYTPIAMIREGADARGLAGLDIEIRYASILDAETTRAAMKGVDAVFHLASPYLIWAKDPDDIVRPAIEGTRNVFQAAKDAGVSRVVYTSSGNTLAGTKDPHKPLTESSIRNAATFPYFVAKWRGEQTAQALAETLDLEMMAILPTSVVGALDYKPTPSNQPLWEAANHRMPVPFWQNFVDVRDVAAGHRLAFEKGRDGERYIIGSENLSPDQIADTMVDLNLGLKRPATSLPPVWVLKMVAPLMQGLSRITGKPPMITSEAIHDVLATGLQYTFDISKARRELDYAPRSSADAIAESLRWGAFVGALKPDIAKRVSEALPPDPSWRK